MNNFFRSLQSVNFFRYKGGKQFTKPKKGTKEAKVYQQKQNITKKAREQITQMNKNIGLNTPKVCAGLLLVGSLPQFYFYYQAIWKDYSDREFITNLRKSLDYQLYKNAFFGSVIFGLEAVKFVDQKAKSLMYKKSPAFLLFLIPVSIGLFTHSFGFEHKIDKKVIFPSYFNDVSLLMIEALLSNQGVIPFWLFNLRYQVHLFDIFFLTCIYFSFKHLNQDLEKNPHRYLQNDIIQKQNIGQIQAQQ